MPSKLLIQVKQDDEGLLGELSELVGDHGRRITTRPLDGVMWVGLVLTLSPYVASVLKAWIDATAKRATSTRITMGGVTVEGYSKDDFLEIVRMLDMTSDE